jgi:hypothetical protein
MPPARAPSLAGVPDRALAKAFLSATVCTQAERDRIFSDAATIEAESKQDLAYRATQKEQVRSADSDGSEDIIISRFDVIRSVVYSGFNVFSKEQRSVIDLKLTSDALERFRSGHRKNDDPMVRALPHYTEGGRNGLAHRTSNQD